MNTAAGLRVVSVLLLLGGCAVRHPQAVQAGRSIPPIVPGDLQSCPRSPPGPAPMPRIRSVRQLADFAKASERARHGSVAARNACAGTLSRLLEWIAEFLTQGRH